MFLKCLGFVSLSVNANGCYLFILCVSGCWPCHSVHQTHCHVLFWHMLMGVLTWISVANGQIYSVNDTVCSSLVVRLTVVICLFYPPNNSNFASSASASRKSFRALSRSSGIAFSGTAAWVDESEPVWCNRPQNKKLPFPPPSPTPTCISDFINFQQLILPWGLGQCCQGQPEVEEGLTTGWLVKTVWSETKCVKTVLCFILWAHTDDRQWCSETSQSKICSIFLFCFVFCYLWKSPVTRISWVQMQLPLPTIYALKVAAVSASASFFFLYCYLYSLCLCVLY